MPRKTDIVLKLRYCGGIGPWLVRLFPARELILRTDGRVRYMRVSTFAQAAAVVVVFATLAWNVGASVGVWVQDTRVQAAHAEYDRLMGIRAALEDKIAEQENTVRDATARGDGLADNLRFLLAGLSDAVGGDDEKDAADNLFGKRAAVLLDRLNHLHSAQSDIIENLKLRTDGSIEDAERIIAMTGLKVAKVLDGVDAGAPADGAEGENLGQGGPFIAALPNSPVADGFAGTLVGLDTKLHRSEQLRRVMGSMPLISPIDSYSIASSYGRRKDPFTKKRAMHKGLDLAAPKRTPVRATAPGRVVFAGWNGKYGRMVEIRHGNGFRSRYGHLRKTLVKKGQQVDHRQKIGLLGNTGRSTGPHVHYEVWFKDRTMNPIKFIKAGKHVFKE